MNKPKSKNRKYMKEIDIQIHLVRWFKKTFPRLQRLFFHVPNGTHATSKTGAIMKKAGVVAGVADMLLLLPSKDGLHTFLALELKTKYGVQSDEQVMWGLEVNKKTLGKYIVAKSLESAQHILAEYIEGENYGEKIRFSDSEQDNTTTDRVELRRTKSEPKKLSTNGTRLNTRREKSPQKNTRSSTKEKKHVKETHDN